MELAGSLPNYDFLSRFGGVGVRSRADVWLQLFLPDSDIHPLDNQNKPHFRYFTSNSLEAKFVMGAWEKTKGQTPAE